MEDRSTKVKKLIIKLVNVEDEEEHSFGSMGILKYPLINRNKFNKDYIIQINYSIEKIHEGDCSKYEEVSFMFFENTDDLVRSREFFNFFENLKEENQDKIINLIEQYILVNS